MSKKQDPKEEDYHIVSLKIQIGYDQIDAFYEFLKHKHSFNEYDTCKCGTRFED